MSTVYITEQGAVLRQSSRHLVVTKGKQRLAHLPILKINRLVIVGNVQMTTQAMNVLLQEGIDVTFLSTRGKLRGRLVATESKNVFARLAQYERFLDDEYQLETARAIVAGKLTNARAVMRLYQKNHPELDFSPELNALAEILQKIQNQRTPNSLRGSEGTGTATYFRAFGRMFSGELRFTRRKRRPPGDPVNALLSLGYSLITNEVVAAVTASGLDPYIGFLHGAVYGRPSLALDIVEEFRHPTIDRFVLNLFNNQLFTLEDFRTEACGGCYLKADALKRFFMLYEKRMQEKIAAGRPEIPDQNYRDIIKTQVQTMSHAIQHREIYQPYQMRW